MMKKGWITWIITIAVLAMTVGGTTLAWFTATAPVQENTFTAGTVEIEAGGDVGSGQVGDENWNPGDVDDFKWEIINKGTKSIYIRAKLDLNWLPNQYRLFVVYTGKTVQLLAMEWNQEITGSPANGPIAIGDLMVKHPSNNAYMIGEFRDLGADSVIENGTKYNLWCIDHDTFINKNIWHEDVMIFDPISNPDWYTEVDVQPEWRNIPINKIAFIINQNYLAKGYSVDDMQNAIWHFTNGDAVSGKAQEIVDMANAGYELPTNNVTFTLGANWLYRNGYYYYKDVVPGSYTESNSDLRTIMFDAQLTLNGETTGNEYQGRSFVATVRFEAIQSSNNAVDDAWPGHPYNEVA